MLVSRAMRAPLSTLCVQRSKPVQPLTQSALPAANTRKPCPQAFSIDQARYRAVGSPQRMGMHVFGWKQLPDAARKGGNALSWPSFSPRSKAFSVTPTVMQQQQQQTSPPPPGWLDDPNSQFLLRFDGSARGNPGFGASAAVIWRDGTLLWRGSFIHEECTSNQAEYFGLILGLRAASVLGARRLRAEGDSKLVINQLKGSWQCKHEGLQLLYSEAKSMVGDFERVELGHVLRQQNLEADELVTQALSEHRKVNEILDTTDSWLCVEMDQEASDKHYAPAPAARPVTSHGQREVEVFRRRVRVLDASGYLASYHIIV